MSITFDRDGAVKYARQYALSPYNQGKYSYYQGQDCVNFVSQCLHDGGGVPMNMHGNLWYSDNGHTYSWTLISAFRKWLRIPWGKYHFNYTCPPSPTGLLRGDIVFTSKTAGTPGDINRDMSHVIILSEDYDGSGKMIVCGHSVDQLDAQRVVEDNKMVYVHFIPDFEIIQEYTDEDYISDEDFSTASASMGLMSTVLATGSKGSNVRALQTRLNFLGFDCGKVDGVFGSGTKTAVTAFQTYFRKGRKLTEDQFDVDGKAGEQTKEALRYPKDFFIG